MKREIVRDIPIGIILLLVAQFAFYGVMYFSKFPATLEFLAIVALVLLADRLILAGIRLIKGVEVDNN